MIWAFWFSERDDIFARRVSIRRPVVKPSEMMLRSVQAQSLSGARGLSSRRSFFPVGLTGMDGTNFTK